jgi:hypothetical protein
MARSSTSDYFIQTLTTLYLGVNQIGAQGAQYLGEALQKNTVRQKQSLHLYHIHLYYFIHTLRELDFEKNQVGDEWKKNLNKMEKKNKNLTIFL